MCGGGSWHARVPPPLRWPPLNRGWRVSWKGAPLLLVVATAVAVAAFASSVALHIGGGCPAHLEAAEVTVAAASYILAIMASESPSCVTKRWTMVARRRWGGRLPNVC